MSQVSTATTRRTMVKVSVSSDNNYLIFRTVSTEWKSGFFYMSREELAALNDKNQVFVKDCAYLAELYRNRASGMVTITFYWMECLDGTRLSGRKKKVTIPWTALSDFAEQSILPDGPREWTVLSQDASRFPRLVFFCAKRLREVAENKLVRRKLSKYLRTAFQWPDVDEICFYSDFLPYSFMFREICNGQEGIVGGVILHGQENMSKAYYAIHT